MTHHPNTPASRTEQAAPSVASGVPDGVWEALQRMIEDGLVKGPASQQDARTVMQYRDRVRFLAAPGAAIAAREQEAHPEHARALAEHILSMDLATEKGKHARYLARKVLAKENESPAELALRSLASWLGCGGYNATAIDAGVMERRIRDAIASRQEAPAASAEEWMPVTPEQHSKAFAAGDLMALAEEAGGARMAENVVQVTRSDIERIIYFAKDREDTAARSPATVAQPVDQADLEYENEHPAARRMRLDFEAKYGHSSALMRAANHWFNLRTQWNDAWNRDREEPITEADVDQAERAMLAAQPCPSQGCGGDGGSQE